MKCKCTAYWRRTFFPATAAFRKYAYSGDLEDLEAYRRVDRTPIVEGVEHRVGPRCPLFMRVGQWFSSLFRVGV